MSEEDWDDPAVVLPRVGDVDGTLRRLGFTGYTAKGLQFYRQYVPLFGGGVKAQFVNRNVSHISIVILFAEKEDDPVYGSMYAGKVWLKYGYPERERHRNKLVDVFKPLISRETHLTIDFYPDSALRAAEKSLRFLIEGLKTQQIDTSSMPPWEAVVALVQQLLNNKSRMRCTGQWWLWETPPPPEPKLRIIKADKYSRVPNFYRPLFIRQMPVRPRGVNRRDY